MMCREFEGLIEAYLTEMMHDEGVVEFESHGRTCSKCAERLRKAEALLNETGSALQWAMPEADVTERLVERVATAAIVPERTLGDILQGQWERAPWWMISAAVHAVVLLLMTLVTIATAKRTDEVIITADVLRPEPPKPERHEIRDVFRSDKEIEADEIVENPVFAHEEYVLKDHFETENEMDSRTARGQEDAISDIPLGGTGVVGNIGLGGGGAGCFGYRTGGGRIRAIGKFGGSRLSEGTVDAALRWLAKHQEPDGRWDGARYEGRKVDPGITGLAVLAFLGAGHTESAGKWKSNVANGIRWIRSRQRADGYIGAEYETGLGYHHAICGLALAEAYGMGRRPATKSSAEKAVAFSAGEHQKEYSGWRYKPKMDPDLSVTGWFVMQLKSARVAGLNVPGPAFQGAQTFLDAVTETGGQYPGQCKYKPERTPTTTMTAVGMLTRQFLGARKNDPLLLGGASHLLENLPEWRTEADVNFYYWYYGTLVMFQMGGDHWKAWNSAMRDMLIRHQRKGGDEDGSWDPVGLWCASGGRVYATAVGALCLEVYYRYLPIYNP